jgi:hydroxymethylglutaryl-CoA lyase
LNLPKKVTINEVVLRDGLQLEDRQLSVAEKKNLATRLLHANIRELEFGSFVHPRLVPQMANSGELFKKIDSQNNAALVALIPNMKGAETASEFGVHELNFVFSASNTHNLQNVKQTTDESLVGLKSIEQFCSEKAIKLNASIATTFGCPFEGEITEKRIEVIVQRLIDLNMNRITLADTTGMANPKQVYQLVTRLVEKFPNQSFNLHFHNTRGMGLTNILAAIEAGANSFDTALGGLGGCPFAPGATGNVSTEDVVHMLHCMGIDTGIHLDEVINAAAMLREYVGHELSSSVLKAGKSDRKYAVPTD